ncbi:VanZ family protein [Listeria costaricensis]|uniref:VanZ family protein n=1 Tax=Listeria costaricensis TaxID=2026604 RepID=UPI000C07A695|nr:VanZ family protein [Listeria costaricensis]
MNLQRLKYLVLCLPLLYMAYGATLALQFGSQTELVNSLANGLILFLFTCWLTKRAKLRNWIDFIWFAVFILYIFILHHLVSYIAVGDFMSSTYTGDFHIQKELINLVPFTTIENTFRQALPTMPTIVQVVGNILMLAPLAFFLLYFKIVKRVRSAVFVVFLTSCGIEVVQFIQTTLITGFSGMTLPLERSTDIDDIILNTISGGIGAVIALMIPSVRKRIGKR